jgi:PAS domain S-box-containing protein
MSNPFSLTAEPEFHATQAEPVGRILVVDDEPSLRTVLVQALIGQGFVAKGCSSGMTALEALRAENFDVLLTDLIMPTMSGIELLQRALEIDQHLVPVIMTGQGTIETAVDAMKVGAFDYVLKPFRAQSIVPVITRAIRTRKLHLENVQLRESVALYELSQTIALTLDPQTVLSKIADAALKQIEADEVSILLPTQDLSELYVAAARGENRERLLGERIPFGHSISSWVMREREPLMLNGTVNDDRFVAIWPRPEISSAMSVPMQVGNKLIGIINLNTVGRSRPFTLGQLKAVSILASTGAAALEMASLYTRVQRAEEKYRSIFENAVEGMFQNKPNGGFITVNPAFARILGYDSPNDVLKSVTDIGSQLYVDPGARLEAKRLEQTNAILQGFEFEAYRKDGSKIWLSLNRRSVRDQNGDELYREGSIQDITARTRAEAESAKLTAQVENQRQRLANIITSIPGVVWESWLQPDSTMAVDFISDYIEQMLGYTTEEWQSTPNFWLSITHPEDRERAIREFEFAFKQGGSHQAEYRCLTTDGRTVWVSTNFVVVSDEQGKPIGLRGVTIDIGERKRAEQQLLQEKEFSENLIQTANVIILGLDTDGNINIFNETAEKITGYKLQELKGKNWFDLLVPYDRYPNVREEFDRLIGGGLPTTFENPILTKSGEERIVMWQNNQIRMDGKVIATISFGNDITERKQAESELRFQKSLLESQTEASLDGVLAISSERRILSFNKRLIELWELPAGMLQVGSKNTGLDFEMTKVKDPQSFRARVEYLYKHLDLESSDEIQLKDGRTLDRYTAPIKGSGGEFYGRVWFFRDITEQKLAEEVIVRRARLAALRADITAALSEADVLLQETLSKCANAFVQHLDAALARVWTLNKDENVLELQASAGMYTHLDGDHSRVPIGSKKIGMIAAEKQPQITNNVQTDPRVSDKQWAKREGIVSFAGYPLMVADRLVGVIAFFARYDLKDDTLEAFASVTDLIAQSIERKRAEDALANSEERLRQSQKLEAIGQLAGGVAHDFNNLLTVIGGYSSLLLNRLPSESPHRASIEEIKKAGDRASGLTRQLLAFSRKQILQPKVLDLNSVVSDLEKMVKRLIGEDIDLLTITDPALGRVKADPGQIEQVLLNLIVNSRDAMPNGGKITIETGNARLGPKNSQKDLVIPGNYVILAVSDTGCGMDAATRARVFEPFFTTKGTGKGTGLGLSTVYGIVKQSGGNIWVYSEPGKGTTFKVYLPRIDEVSESDEHATPGRAIPQGTETVLLVEDEEQVRTILQQMLEERGYRLLTASAGEEALRIAADYEAEIQLMITDVVMPQMSGRELAEQIQPLRPNMKVLYMSGYTDDAIVRHGLLDEKLQFLQKPFDAALVARKVRQVLDSGQS